MRPNTFGKNIEKGLSFVQNSVKYRRTVSVAGIAMHVGISKSYANTVLLISLKKNILVPVGKRTGYYASRSLANEIMFGSKKKKQKKKKA